MLKESGCYLDLDTIFKFVNLDPLPPNILSGFLDSLGLGLNDLRDALVYVCTHHVKYWQKLAT